MLTKTTWLTTSIECGSTACDETGNGIERVVVVSLRMLFHRIRKPFVTTSTIVYDLNTIGSYHYCYYSNQQQRNTALKNSSLNSATCQVCITQCVGYLMISPPVIPTITEIISVKMMCGPSVGHYLSEGDPIGKKQFNGRCNIAIGVQKKWEHYGFKHALMTVHISRRYYKHEYPTQEM
eukprot:PhF_6_TR17055/c0_g1_i4/m.26025